MSAPDAQPLVVTPAEVNDLATFTAQLSTELKDALHSVSADVDGLRSSWSGSAASAYFDGWLDVNHGATDVLDALGKLSNDLGSAWSIYDEQEQANTDSYSGARVNMS